MTAPTSIDRDLQAALAAFSAAESADDLDRAYVDLIPPLEPYLDDETLRSVTLAFNIRKRILHNGAVE
ncbi:hypothetical protein [Methylocystis parvus]|uniref:hypothetical protein n=1 Tax=Methylocystis parvus TaxID=134 RepID=UPI003C74DA97